MKEAMAATEMLEGLLRSLRKWRIGYPYSKGCSGVCFIGLREC